MADLTINKLNSNSSFEEENNGPEAEGSIMTGGAGVNGTQTPNGRKRQLSPNELTPLGRLRKMSTKICNSPILRMKHEFWAMLEDDRGVGVAGIVPVNDDVHRDPSTVRVEGRYGLVAVLNEVVTEGNPIAPVMNTEAHYGLVEEGESRKIKTPRRRLGSESVFDRMMIHSLQTPRNRSKSVTIRPSGGG